MAEFSRDPHTLGDTAHDHTERLLRDARLPPLTKAQQRALVDRSQDDEHVSRWKNN